MKNLLITISRIVVAFSLGLILAFSILLFWTTHSSYVNSMGFAAIALAFAIPAYSALLSIPFAVVIYTLFAKFIPINKFTNIIFGGLGVIMLALVLYTATYNSIWYKYDPISNKRIHDSRIRNELIQYSIPTYDNSNFLQKPYHLDEWLTFTDPANRFSIKYPSILTYQSINGKVSFFFKDLKPAYSTKTTLGNELLVLTTNSEITKPSQTIMLREIPIIVTKYNFFVRLGTGDWLSLGYNYNTNNDKYQTTTIKNSFAAVMLQTLELK